MDYVRYLPKPLLEDIIENRCVPIIGAGFSLNADLPFDFKMPLWSDIGKYLAQELNNYPYTTPIDAISAFCHEFSRSKLVEKLRKILYIDNAQPGPAHLGFADLPFDVIITTNFDFLLEKAYDNRRKPRYAIITESQLSISKTNKSTCVLKIHGDLDHPDRLIITEEDYDTFLEKYPLICTYIANLLILRTPLFIGYSLEDQDFRQLWQIIGARLGKLRRYAYVLGVGISDYDVARYNRRGVKVISLPGKASDYGKILNTLFKELRDYWQDKIPEISDIITEEALIELSLPRDAKTRLCYFSIPYKLMPFYQSKIFPIFERYGFSPTTGIDIISPGDSILAKISSLIDRATLIVVDISSSQRVIAELGMALGKGHKVIVIKEKDAEIPSIIEEFMYIERPKFLASKEIEPFLSKLEISIQKISKELIVNLSEEPIRLMEKKEYRAAVISAISLLEIELREKLFQQTQYPIPLLKLLELSIQYGYIPVDKLSSIKEWISIRNELVHTKRSISKQNSGQIVEGILNVIQQIREI
jgi:uncharacterized protein YutE (UPF0331/DUF86 family)